LFFLWIPKICNAIDVKPQKVVENALSPLHWLIQNRQQHPLIHHVAIYYMVMGFSLEVLDEPMQGGYATLYHCLWLDINSIPKLWNPKK